MGERREEPAQSLLGLRVYRASASFGGLKERTGPVSLGLTLEGCVGKSLRLCPSSVEKRAVLRDRGLGLTSLGKVL